MSSSPTSSSSAPSRTASSGAAAIEIRLAGFVTVAGNQNSLAGLIVELTAGQIQANDSGARRRRLSSRIASVSNT